MPSNRRMKAFLAAVVLVVITILYLTSNARSTRNADFYTRTTKALDAQRKAAADKELKAKADADLENILKQAAELSAGDNVPEAAAVKATPIVTSIHNPESEDIKKPAYPAPGADNTPRPETEEAGIAGRIVYPKSKDKASNWEVGHDEEVALNGGKLLPVQDSTIAEAEAELNVILKKSPIIIFSKTTCPFSRRAKALLLDTYTIIPTPHVVELDTLSTGSALQAALAANTGRRTVPNILVNGRSIGGADEITHMDSKGTLSDKIHEMGGRWVHSIERKAS